MIAFGPQGGHEFLTSTIKGNYFLCDPPDLMSQKFYDPPLHHCYQCRRNIVTPNV